MAPTTAAGAASKTDRVAGAAWTVGPIKEIEGDFVLVYRCEVTQLQVTTGIDATEEQLARMGSLQISVWCPHCATGHKILAGDAVIVPGQSGRFSK